MKKMIRTIVCFATALCLSLCAACGTTAADESQTPEQTAETVTVPQSDQGGVAVGEELAATYAGDRLFSLNCVLSESFNPYSLTSAWNQVVDMLVYEPLIALDANFEPQPGLVTAWTTEDGITWTFSVDTSRGFHDGGKVTSFDCAYSLQQAWNSTRYNARFRCIEGISPADETKFVVRLKSADFTFYRLLNIPCIEYGAGGEDTPPGTGPYQFSAAGNVLTLYTDYPTADRMPLKRIYLKEYVTAGDILQAFEDSYIDLTINNPTSLSNLGYSTASITKYVDTTNMHYLGYNMNSTMFSQTAFRSFMTYAIDRASIVSDCMVGAAVAAAAPVHPNNSLYPVEAAEVLNYSPTSLSTALENIGVTDIDGDGELEIFSGVSAVKMAINFIVCSDSAAKVAAARSIAANLEAAGFSMNLRELGYQEYLTALEEGDFDVYYAEVKINGSWDISALFSDEDVEEGGLNYGGVRDTYLQGYLNDCRTAPEEQLPEKLAILSQYIGQQAPITVILFERTEVLYHRGVIYGLAPTQDDYFSAMDSWSVQLTD